MRPAGPVADPVPCSGCSKLLDPLRAGHVAIFDNKFHFFCDRRVCRSNFLGERPGEPEHRSPIPLSVFAPRSTTPADANKLRVGLDAPIVPFHAPASIESTLPEPPALGDDRTLVEPIGRPILTTDEPAKVDTQDHHDIGALLLVIAIIAGILAVVLGLTGHTILVIGARIVLASVGAGMLVGRAATTQREPTDPHPAPLLATSVVSIFVAVWAALQPDRALGSEAASLAGIIVTTTAIGAWIIESARLDSIAERAYVALALAVPGRRAPDDNSLGEIKGKAFDIRPGEQILVERGEVVPVDVVVTSGDIDVYPWLGATTPVRKRPGDPIVAGATVVRGRLRGTCTFVGNDRAFARVLLDPRRRADALAPIARASRALAERWALAAAAIGALSAFIAGGRSGVEIAMTAIGVHGALATVVLACIGSVHVVRGILLAQRRGISYKNEGAWDRAGKVNVAVFCARGTLLLGEPELAELDAVGGKLEPFDVLALAAGAERGEEHPIAMAIVRAAMTRNVRPDGVRNAHHTPGLGVTAVASSGEDLCVGSRALLLANRISIAAAEQRIAELEALGRTVVLVAVGTRLVGMLGLQDGLRPGARAAVQHLIDAQIEPVIMSGDARETCEAIARSLDVDHIRPEVLPLDRSAEVRRLIEAGMSVAVLGHTVTDETALGAADVAVALDAAGVSSGDLSIGLASDDVRDAALALALAHRSRLDARLGLAIAALPALIGAMAVAFGLLPPAYAPLASLLGGAMAVLHVRAIHRTREPQQTRMHALGEDHTSP